MAFDRLCLVDAFRTKIEVFTVIVCCVCFVTVASRSDNNGCTAVRTLWKSKALGDNQHVPSSPMPGGHLSVCGTPGGSGGGSEHFMTCCTRQMEAKMTSNSRQQYSNILANKLDGVKQNFQTQASTFENFCTELIDKSGRELHSMFTRTYGVLYQQNSQVFSELFRDLRAYFRGGDNDLGDVLDAFFSSLLLRMFTLLNGQYVFDERYLGCISERSNELVPFSDVPQKLGTQVKRAFIAARTFRHGLGVARDVVTLLAKMELSTSCQRAVTKMLYCPMCRGVTTGNVKPCSGYCLNVMRGCLVQQPDLITTWTAFIESMLKVADRLEGPFSIENVLDPMDVKISEAIMNFQENAEAVTSKVFHMCGQPNLGSRSKRDVDRLTTKSSRRRQGQGQGRRTTTASIESGNGSSLLSTTSSPAASIDGGRRVAPSGFNETRTGWRRTSTASPPSTTSAVLLFVQNATHENVDELTADAAVTTLYPSSSSSSLLPVESVPVEPAADVVVVEVSTTVSTTQSTTAGRVRPERGGGGGGGGGRGHHHRRSTTALTTTTTTTTTTPRPTTKPTTTTTAAPPPRRVAGARTQAPRQPPATSRTPAAAAGGGGGGSGRRQPGSGRNAGQAGQASDRNPGAGVPSSSESGGSSERRGGSGTSSHTEYEQMMSNMRTTLTSTQNFFDRLSDAMCVGLSANPNEEARCWNGTARARYTTAVVDVGAESQMNNREVDYDARRQSTVVNQAILQLRLITDKLKRAHSGLEVEWTDDSRTDDEGGDVHSNDYDDDEDLDGSGSGSSPDSRNVVPPSRRHYEGSGYDPSPYRPPVYQPPPPPPQQPREYPERPSGPVFPTKRTNYYYSTTTQPPRRVYFTTKSRPNQRVPNAAAASVHFTVNTHVVVLLVNFLSIIINVAVRFYDDRL